MYRTILIATTLILTFILTACDGPVSALQDMEEANPRPVIEGVQQPSTPASSNNGAIISRHDVFQYYYAPCLDDLIQLEGEVQLVLRSGQSGGNSGVHIVDRRIYQLQGTGLITGATYQVQRIAGLGQTNTRLPYGSTTTSTMHFKIIEPGKGIVLRVQSVEHVTVNANGDIIVDLNNVTSECSP